MDVEWGAGFSEGGAAERAVLLENTSVGVKGDGLISPIWKSARH